MTIERPEAMTVAAVGDLMVGDSAISVGYGFASRYPKTMEEVVRRIRPLFGNARFVFGNLECALSRRGFIPGVWRTSQMRGWPAYARDLRQAGFTHLSLANNHSTQHGEGPFRDTVGYLEEVGIRVCGLRGKDGWAAQPVLEEVAGSTMGVLAYSLRPRQFSPETPPYAEGPEDQVLADVRRLKAQVDRVIVSLHWGGEYTAHPSAEEVRLGHAVVDAGASLVLGHHPHVLRPVECYGNGVIAYSLGNFLSNMVWQRKFQRTGILKCELDDPVGSVSFFSTEIDGDYVPKGMKELGRAELAHGVTGLSPEEYQKMTKKAERQQRLFSYVHAMKNFNAYEKRVLTQLVWNTARNRLRSFLRGR